MRKIKFGEISISSASRKHIQDCLDDNHVTMGKKTALLEERWSGLFNYKYTIAVSSGTSACMAANMVLYDFGAVPGDEVIVPALSFIATANAVRAAGLKPVFCDVKEDLLIDETKIEKLITKKTRAIMPVALMGKPPKMDVIRDIVDKHKLKLILDSCEGAGCRYDGKYMSKWADMVVYSCYAAHLLFSVQEGMLCTRNKEIAEIAKSIRSHGRQPDSLYFQHDKFGLNLNPTDLHSSIGLGNVNDFWHIYKKRKDNWRYLVEKLAKLSDFFWFSDEDDVAETSPHGFSMTVKPNTKVSCRGLEKAFDEANIDWKRNFGCMATQHKCFTYLGHKLGDFPRAEYIGDNGIHVGVHQFLEKKDLQRIVKTIKNYVRES